jgi:hypothetical protein
MLWNPWTIICRVFVYANGRNARTSRYETNTAGQWASRYTITPPHPTGKWSSWKVRFCRSLCVRTTRAESPVLCWDWLFAVRWDWMFAVLWVRNQDGFMTMRLDGTKMDLWPCGWMEPRWIYDHEVGWNQDGFMTMRLDGTKMGLWPWGWMEPRWVYNYEIGWTTVGGSRNCA